MFYIVATPIGNLKETTFRAVETLKEVDYIICEDTRTSRVFLNHYDIKKPMFSYHKFNEKEKTKGIVKDLIEGKNIALISDAGMPCISDPGGVLVQEIVAQNLPYTVVSGATSLINAFVLSGFSSPFSFLGFLPEKKKQRKAILEEVKFSSFTQILFVSPHDIMGVFEELKEVFGDRKVCVVRELTKKFESIEHTTLDVGYSGKIKGEFVLVLEGYTKNIEHLNNLSIKEHIEYYLEKEFTKNDAIKQVAKDRKLKKNDIYKIAIEI